MISKVDYHTHSVLSDGKNTYEEMVLAAISKEITEIGFSDHFCLKPVIWALSFDDIPVMTTQIREIRDKYSDIINVRFGIEVDYFPDKHTEIKEMLDKLPLDYIIGSVHFIDDWNFDTDKSLYGKWSNDELYKRYFKLIKEAAKSGLFDIIGHLDIIKKFRIYPESNQIELFEEVVKTIKENNLVVELNTGGLDRPCEEFTPSISILELCYKHKVPVTISSDAHCATEIGRYYDLAINILKHIGYTEIIGFKGRCRRSIKI